MDKTIKIEKISANDLSQLRELEAKCFSLKENFEFVLASDSHIYFKAEADGKIVGYAGASIQYEQSDLLFLCVDKAFRRRGIATRLMKKLEAYLAERKVQSVFLEVNENNAAAIDFYLATGYKKITTRKNYYGKHSAVIMKKDL